MWKYVSRRIRDTFERSANYFDKRSATGITSPPNNSFNEKKQEGSSPCCWFRAQKCWGSYHTTADTKNKGCFDQLNGTWLGAITWSSALVLGWYASQLIHLKYKYRQPDDDKKCPSNLIHYLKPYAITFGKKSILLEPAPKLSEVVRPLTPNIYLVSNDHSEASSTAASTSSGSSKAATDNELSNVLNSIENRLGVASIGNGQHKDGLNLLRSAASRNHAPALYNLALCYEEGLGVKADEKMAMELYRSAAALEHPQALYNLGIYYAQGRGSLTRDYAMATRLLRLAAIKGNEDAITALKSLDIEPEESPKEQVPTFSYYTEPENVPTQSSLFVNQFMTSALLAHKCESTVY